MMLHIVWWLLVMCFFQSLQNGSSDQAEAESSKEPVSHVTLPHPEEQESPRSEHLLLTQFSSLWPRGVWGKQGRPREGCILTFRAQPLWFVFSHGFLISLLGQIGYLCQLTHKCPFNPLPFCFWWAFLSCEQHLASKHHMQNVAGTRAEGTALPAL